MARCPICFTTLGYWTDDPIKTPKGLAGGDYIGFTDIKAEHIVELQEERAQQEIEVGISESNRTSFTPVQIEGQYIDITKQHILELRESTEKILNAIGQTKEGYFNYDNEGTEYNIGEHQLDWIDSDLETEENNWIRAIHIEDLRHYLALFESWIETFNNTIGFPSDYVEYLGGVILEETSTTTPTFDHNWTIEIKAGVFVGQRTIWNGYPGHITNAGWEILNSDSGKKIRIYGKAEGYVGENKITINHPSSHIKIIKCNPNLKIITSGNFTGDGHDFGGGLEGIRIHLEVEIKRGIGDYITLYYSMMNNPPVEYFSVDDITNLNRILKDDYETRYGAVDDSTWNNYEITWIKISTFAVCEANPALPPGTLVWTDNWYDFYFDYIKLANN